MDILAFISDDEAREAKERAKYNMYHTKVEVQMIEVIKVTTTEGGASVDDPVRIVTRYFNKDGELLAKNDPIVPL